MTGAAAGAMIPLDKARAMVAKANGPDLSDEDLMQLLAFMGFLADRLLETAPAAALQPLRKVSAGRIRLPEVSMQ